MSLFDPQPNFVEHDSFLFAVLGLAGANEKWRALLLANDIESDAPAPIREALLEVEATDDDVVLALLGICSLSTKVQELLQEWTDESSNMTDSPTSGAFGFDEIDDLLR